MTLPYIVYKDAFVNCVIFVQVSVFDIDDGRLFRGLICSSHSQVSGHCQKIMNWWKLIQLKFRIVDLTNPRGPHFTVQVANLPFNLISCFLAEVLKRWKFSGFAAHCFTDKHATVHNAFRSSGIPESAKLGEPRFGGDTRHPEKELGPKETVCQGLLFPGLLRVAKGESVEGGTWEGWSCCHPSSWRSARQKNQIILEVLIFYTVLMMLNKGDLKQLWNCCTLHCIASELGSL